MDFSKFGDILLFIDWKNKKESLFGMFEEPLVKEARLDVTEESMLGLTQIQCTSRIVKLKHTVDVVGPELNDIKAKYFCWDRD